MSVFEEIIISITKKNMSSALNLNAAKEISTEGIKEERDISYYNRSGKELFMDIF